MSDQLTSDLASLKIDRSPPAAPRRGARPIVALLVVAALVAAGGLAYSRLEARIFKATVAVGEIALVAPDQAPAVLTATGYVVPQVVSRVGARVSGRIAQIAVKESDRVKAGDLLARLEDADERKALATSTARALAAQARVRVAGANLAELRQQVTRERALVARGVSAPAGLQDLEARVHSLEESVGAADAELRAAQAEVEAIKVSLSYMTVVAPISGVVISRTVQLGELVGPQAANILELADFDSLQVEVDVPESSLQTVRAGGPCEVVLDAYPSRRYRGRVEEIGSRIDRAKATAKVKVKLVDDATGVLPDMSARVTFVTEERTREQLQQPPRRVVPAAAVIERGGGRALFVIDGEKVRLTPVVLGPAFAGGYELKEGPAPGTRVVLNPAPTLGDGQAIKSGGG